MSRTSPGPIRYWAESLAKGLFGGVADGLAADVDPFATLAVVVLAVCASAEDRAIIEIRTRIPAP
jgi:hypothetical protein